MKKKTAIVNVRNISTGTLTAHSVRVTTFETIAEAVEKLGEAKALELLNYAHQLQTRAKKFNEIRSKA